MVNPDMKPVAPATVIPPPIFVQSWEEALEVLYSTTALLPATTPAVTVPIVVSAAGFLIINASASGQISAPRVGSMVIKVDGVTVPFTTVGAHGGVGLQPNWSIAARVPITAGIHTVTVEFGLTVLFVTLTIDPATNPNSDSCSVTVIESAA